MMKVIKLSVSETSYPILFIICVIMKSPLNILSFQGKESIFLKKCGSLKFIFINVFEKKRPQGKYDVISIITYISRLHIKKSYKGQH